MMNWPGLDTNLSYDVETTTTLAGENKVSEMWDNKLYGLSRNTSGAASSRPRVKEGWKTNLKLSAAKHAFMGVEGGGAKYRKKRAFGSGWKGVPVQGQRPVFRLAIMFWAGSACPAA